MTAKHRRIFGKGGEGVVSKGERGKIADWDNFWGGFAFVLVRDYEDEMCTNRKL